MSDYILRLMLFSKGPLFCKILVTMVDVLAYIALKHCVTSLGGVYNNL